MVTTKQCQYGVTKKGAIIYHPITGEGRPWIVKESGPARVLLLNLDDEGVMTMHPERLREFYTYDD